MTRVQMADRVALYGKLPWAADYVRVHHVHPAAIALDTWLKAATQPLALARASWPSERAYYLLHVPSATTVLAGVLAPSRDRAGRKFPVSIFAPLPSLAVRSALAALPRFLEPFLRAAEAVLDRAPTLDKDETSRAVEALQVPRLSGLREVHEQLAGELRTQSLERIARPEHAPPVESPGGDLDAVDALKRACSASAVKGAAQAPVLDCPIEGARDVERWLSRVADVAFPSAFWTPHASEPRMLLALGAVPVALPLWLSVRGRRHERLLSL